jgi:uncharacterized UBP type Zn finger protein
MLFEIQRLLVML